MANTKDIRGTRTEKCLVAAYVSESTAYTRYTYYAQQADKEQYFPIVRFSAKRQPTSCTTAKCSSGCFRAARLMLRSTWTPVL